MNRSSLNRNLFRYAIGILILLCILLVAVEVFYVQPQTAQDRASFITTIGSVVGGSALLIGLFFTWNQLQITLDSQITDRLSKAVEQIGSDNLSVRIGGLYALERIAIDSDRDILNIVEILCAFIRVNSPSEFINRGVFATANEQYLSQEQLDKIRQMIFNPPRPKEDIQVCLQVIANLVSQKHISKDEFTQLKLNLSGVNLIGAYIPEGLGLTNFFLDKSNLDFFCAPKGRDLTGIRANSANLRGSRLNGAILKNADLSSSFIEGGILTEAILEECRFVDSRLDDAMLVGARAKKASFNKARLVKAKLWDADLSDVDFRFAKMQGADLKKTNLTQAAIDCADLQEADLEGAILKGTKLYKTNLRNAKNLTKGQLSQALLCQTILPDGTTSNRDCQQMGIVLKESTNEEK
ncbi:MULTISPECIES: pentapeptide repeat-containing protein [Spirulina sp. CCY15215]|uniref:pentapeptide repeat-containing protein n=1 Tax=Spirulina sp. CCY15215 TaxID=2767591 RepID=UPI0019514F71|nr:pentapeptide repeat-containing protein [Spirulina major]